MSKKIHVFCHSDLDGFTSLMVVKWMFPTEVVTYQPISNASLFRNTLTTWLTQNSFNKFDQIYILDLDVSDSYDLIDHKNVFIVDHHESHLTKKPEHKNASVVVKEYPSACKLLYKVFEKIFKLKLNNNQKTLIALTDDYDSYTMKVPMSRQLNIIFWNTNKRFETLAKKYSQGFTGFDLYERNKLIIYFNELKELIKGLKFFEGEYEDYTVISTFTNDKINDVADYMVKKYNKDIAIIVNINDRRVYFRCSPTFNDDLSTIAVDICGEKEAGGHLFAAGGNMTHSFMEFAKNLKPL